MSVPDLHGTVASSWARAPAALQRAGVALTDRTCETTVAAWTRLDVPVPTAVDPALAIVLGSGVAWVDLLAFCKVCLQGASIPEDAARVLNERLRIDFAQDAPEMAVRDALGWMLVAAQVQGYPFALADAWAALDPTGSGWVFVAAGLSLSEASEAVASGEMDADRARLLVALQERMVVPVS